VTFLHLFQYVTDGIESGDEGACCSPVHLSAKYLPVVPMLLTLDQITTGNQWGITSRWYGCESQLI
jgi:hypothetical protein